MPEADFPKKPLELLKHFKEILGEDAFQPLERSIAIQFKNTFEIGQRETGDIEEIVEIARRNFIHLSLQASRQTAMDS